MDLWTWLMQKLLSLEEKLSDKFYFFLKKTCNYQLSSFFNFSQSCKTANFDDYIMKASQGYVSIYDVFR